MTQPATIERITRSLAYMLRHQPEKFDLELDPYGWGDVDDVLRALNEKLGEAIELADMEEAIGSGDRPRYQIENGRVRALYGHSIEVLPGEPSTPPEFLFVGVSSRDAERALRNGLRGGRRRFLHLARTAEEAREVGRRTAREYAVLRVFALDAWEEGINFFDRKALFLSEEVPTEFIEILDSYDDGEEPMPRGRPERSPRGRDGDRPRSRENGRSRGGRGRGRDDGPRRERDEGERRPRATESRPDDSSDQRPAERERRPAREDRPARADRPARDERRPRERRPERDDERPREPAAARAERPRRDERPAAAERAPAPAPTPAQDDSSEPFGVGVVEPVTPRAPRPAPAPRSKPEPEPEQRKPVEPPPQPEPTASENDGDDPFGAGL